MATAGSGSVVGVSAEVHIAGEGCRLTLRLMHWESPELTSGPDANWVVGEVELVTGSTGRFSARHPVSIRTDEMARFRAELASLLETLTGEVSGLMRARFSSGRRRNWSRMSGSWRSMSRSSLSEPKR